MNRSRICLALLLGLVCSAFAQPATPLPRVRVHSGGHLLETDDGRPFFWLGDTAWELIHRTTREECSYYLHARASQRFTVIQTVVLENDGSRSQMLWARGRLSTMMSSGRIRNISIAWWRDCDEAAAQGLYVALLPTWGDKLTAPWGEGPRLFRMDNLPDARAYARYLAALLKDEQT